MIKAILVVSLALALGVQGHRPGEKSAADTSVKLIQEALREQNLGDYFEYATRCDDLIETQCSVVLTVESDIAAFADMDVVEEEEPLLVARSSTSLDDENIILEEDNSAEDEFPSDMINLDEVLLTVNRVSTVHVAFEIKGPVEKYTSRKIGISGDSVLDPMLGGVMVETVPRGGSGTFGGILCDQRNEIYAVSNNHVWREIGGRAKTKALELIGNVVATDYSSDSTLVKIDNAFFANAQSYDKNGDPVSMTGHVDPSHMMIVAKHGGRTHFSRGVIISTADQINSEPWKILISPIAYPRFKDNLLPDSGSQPAPRNEPNLWSSSIRDMAFEALFPRSRSIREKSQAFYDKAMAANVPFEYFALPGDSGSFIRRNSDNKPVCLLHSGYWTYSISTRKPLHGSYVKFGRRFFKKYLERAKQMTYCSDLNKAKAILQRNLRRTAGLPWFTLGFCQTQRPFGVKLEVPGGERVLIKADYDEEATAFVDRVIEGQGLEKPVVLQVADPNPQRKIHRTAEKLSSLFIMSPAILHVHYPLVVKYRFNDEDGEILMRTEHTVAQFLRKFATTHEMAAHNLVVKQGEERINLGTARQGTALKSLEGITVAGGKRFVTVEVQVETRRQTRIRSSRQR